MQNKITTNRAVLIFLTLMLVSVPGVKGQVRWTAEFHCGLPVNINMPLTISQNGKPDINLIAKWDAETFDRPYIWMWRVGRWNGSKGWEIETLHHKMVLVNRPARVQWLSITHGFNTLSLNRGWQIEKIFLRAGAGAVIAHPESTIDQVVFNQESGIFNMGYYLTGPVIMTSAAWPIRLSNWFLINLEGKMTAGYGNVPIVDGRAKFIHLAFHLNAGLGFSVKGRK